MTSRIANAAAKIPAANNGPRQLSTMPPCDLLSNTAEQLPLILPIGRDRVWSQDISPIPHAVELPQAATELLRYFDPLTMRRLRTPPPPPRKLIKVIAIRTIAPNSEPFALSQSGQQTQVRRAQGQSQFTFPLQPVRQREPFIFGTFTRCRAIAQVRKRDYCHRNGKLCCCLAPPPQPKEHRSCADCQNRDQR